MPQAFLLTPFTARAAGREKPELYEAVQKAVKEAAQTTGVDLIRADDIFAGGVIIDQIEEAIQKSDIVIAICTGKNANVFFELGLAEAMGHRPILVAPTTKHLPFDQTHWRCQMYGKGHLDDLAERVARAITETLRQGRKRPAAQADAQTPETAVESGNQSLFGRIFAATVAAIDEDAAGLIEVTGAGRLSGELMSVLEPNAFGGAAKLLTMTLPVADHHADWLPRLLRPLAKPFGDRQTIQHVASQQWIYLYLSALLCAVVDREEWSALGQLLVMSAPPTRDDDAPLLINTAFGWPQGYFGDASVASAALDRLLHEEQVASLACEFRQRREVIPAASLLTCLSRAVWEERRGVPSGSFGAWPEFLNHQTWAYGWIVRQLDTNETLVKALGAQDSKELAAIAAAKYPDLRQMMRRTPRVPVTWEALGQEAGRS